MPEKTVMDDDDFDLADYAQNLVLQIFIGALKLLPYRWRVTYGARGLAWVIAPFAGWRQRVRRNLALVLPDLAPAEVERLVRAVPANAMRTMIEIYSPHAFKSRLAKTPISGAGLAALDAARVEGRGVILISGHFGNYDVPRAVLAARGHSIGALYKPMQNRYFNHHYRAAIAAIATPVFPSDRRGLVEMVRHLRAGGLIGMLIDIHAPRGAPLRFFGRRAMTAVSAAEMALKHNTLLVPVYGLRLPDGTNFELIIEPPIPHTTAEAMTQALNDSLEIQVRAHPEQWFWIHRRWK